MNRRLFVRQLATGLSLPLLPAVPSIAFGGMPTQQSRHSALLKSSLGALQHITIAYVYSPEHTSVSALKASLLSDLVTVNELLGTVFLLTERVWASLSTAPYGSYSTQLKQDSVTLTWQALARTGSAADKPSVRVIVYGSNGALQASHSSEGYQLIDWHGKAVALSTPLSNVVNQLPRSAFFSV